jgi:hypothetical protein
LNDASAVLEQAQASSSSADTPNDINLNGELSIILLRSLFLMSLCTGATNEKNVSGSSLSEEQEEQPAPAPRRKLPPRRAGSATPSQSGSAAPEGPVSGNTAAAEGSGAGGAGAQSDAEPVTDTQTQTRRVGRLRAHESSSMMTLAFRYRHVAPQTSCSDWSIAFECFPWA